MKSLTDQFTRRLCRVGAICLTLTCSACMTTQQSVTSSPKSGPVQAIYKEPSREVAGRKPARQQRETEIQQLNHADNSGAEGSTRIHRDSAIQGVAHFDESGAPANTIQTASYQAPAICPDNVTIESCPPEPRWPAAGPNPMAPGMTFCDVCNLPSTEKYSDEYLCDGGDRDIPIHYDSFNRRGLDTEDTVLEYTNREGSERVKPSNQVCVYAPRFSSVRTVSRPHEGSSTSEVAGVGQLATTIGMHTRLKASTNVKREMTGRMASRSRVSGLDNETVQSSMSQLRRLSAHDKVLNLYQSLTFVRFGRVDDADSARLNYGLQAALAWSREQYPVITAKTDMVLEGHFEESVATITCIDDQEKPEDLRIIKLADKKTASPGDEIEFTIRFDNLGGSEVYHIRIVDNLTPRLQYIEGTATTDLDGKLILQDNGEGSQVVIFELEKPLPPKSGGVVTFKALVR